MLWPTGTNAEMKSQMTVNPKPWVYKHEESCFSFVDVINVSAEHVLRDSWTLLSTSILPLFLISYKPSMSDHVDKNVSAIKFHMNKWDWTAMQGTYCMTEWWCLTFSVPNPHSTPKQTYKDQNNRVRNREGAAKGLVARWDRWAFDSRKPSANNTTIVCVSNMFCV